MITHYKYNQKSENVKYFKVLIEKIINPSDKIKRVEWLISEQREQLWRTAIKIKGNSI